MKKFKAGDRLIKTGVPSIVWVVVGEAPVTSDLPHHYYLVDEAYQKRRISISESALLDRRLFQRVSDFAPAREK